MNTFNNNNKNNNRDLNLVFLISEKMLDPQDFVRHLHSDRENRTCHWGFDPVHWRCYVHLDETVYSKSKRLKTSLTSFVDEPVKTSLTVHDATDLLNEIKARFVHSSSSSKKRKQVGRSPLNRQD